MTHKSVIKVCDECGEEELAEDMQPHKGRLLCQICYELALEDDPDGE